MNIAVAVFGFNRPDHISNLLDSISKSNDYDSFDHYGFVDGPRNDSESSSIQKVHDLLLKSNIFKKIFRKNSNVGLAPSIIAGVDELFSTYDAVIVLEDDLIVSSGFYNYMSSCLEKYKDVEDVFSISGFNYPIIDFTNDGSYPYDTFLSYRPHSWGWATYKDRWVKAIWEITDDLDVFVEPVAKEMFNRGGDDLTNMLKLQHEKKINSWAIRWAYTHYKYNKLSVYPIHSHVKNNGFDGSGTHCKGIGFENDLSIIKPDPTFPPSVEINDEIAKKFKDIFSVPSSALQPSRRFSARLKNKIKSFLNKK